VPVIQKAKAEPIRVLRASRFEGCPAFTGAHKNIFHLKSIDWIDMNKGENGGVRL